MATTTRTASCLCGGVKLKIEGDQISTNLCHCTSCQKFTGSFCASLAVYNTEQVTLVESDLLQKYDDTTPESGNVIVRSFCSRCGSAIMGQRRAGDEASHITVIPIGIIDAPKDVFKPTLEYFCRNRTPWLGEIGGATTFEKLPPHVGVVSGEEGKQKA